MIYPRRRPVVNPVELLVVLLILAVLAALLFPVFSTRFEGHPPSCKSHLRQLSVALQMYLQDYDNRYPPAAYVMGTQSYTLPGLLHTYIKNKTVWECPQAHPERDSLATYDLTPADTTVDYGYNAAALNRNGRGITLDQVAAEEATVAFAESSSYRTAPNALTPALGGTPPAYRHEEYTTIGWADGHVQRLEREVLEKTVTREHGRQLGSGIDCYPYWNLR